MNKIKKQISKAKQAGMSNIDILKMRESARIVAEKMEKQAFDYGIIGSGPAGNTAAFIAAKQGFSVVLFEKDELGGVCLNRGCIPTKTILHTVELYHDAKNAENIGIETNDIKLNI